MDSFFKHVPKDMVPEEYGGNAGSLKDISGKPPILLNENFTKLLELNFLVSSITLMSL